MEYDTERVFSPRGLISSGSGATPRGNRVAPAPAGRVGTGLATRGQGLGGVAASGLSKRSQAVSEPDPRLRRRAVAQHSGAGGQTPRRHQVVPLDESLV